MASPEVQRKLAAILAADVAGYSRLVGADEEGTLARLRALRRELIDSTIAEHRGVDRDARQLPEHLPICCWAALLAGSSDLRQNPKSSCALKERCGSTF